MLKRKAMKIMTGPGIRQVHIICNYITNAYCHIGVDVKMLVSQVAKELEKKTKKKNPHAHDSLSGISGRRFSEESKPKSRASSMPVWKSSSSGPVSAPIVEDEQTDYVNEGEDVEEDEIYENTEPEEVYLNTASRDDIYKQQLSEPIVTQSPPGS